MSSINLFNLASSNQEKITGTSVDQQTGTATIQPQSSGGEVVINSSSGNPLISTNSADDSLVILQKNVLEIVDNILESDANNLKKLATVKAIVDFINGKIVDNTTNAFNSKAEFDTFLASPPTKTTYCFVSDTVLFSFTDSSGITYSNVEWMELIVIVEGSVTTKVTSTNLTSDVTEEKVVSAMSGGVTDNYFVTQAEKLKIANTPTNTNVSLATLTNNKVDKIAGKGLSSVDYVATDKQKVDNIPANTNSELAALTTAIDTKLNKDNTNIKGNIFSLPVNEIVDEVLVLQTANNGVPSALSFRKSGNNRYGMIVGDPSAEDIDVYLGDDPATYNLTKVATFKNNGFDSPNGYFMGGNSKFRSYTGSQLNDGVNIMFFGHTIGTLDCGLNIVKSWNSTASKNNVYFEFFILDGGTRVKAMAVSPSNVKMNKDTVVEGTLTVNGNTSVNGNLTVNGELINKNSLTYTDNLIIQNSEKTAEYIVSNWVNNTISFCNTGGLTFPLFPAITENGSSSTFKIGDKFTLHNFNAGSSITLNLKNGYFLNKSASGLSPAGDAPLAPAFSYEFIASKSTSSLCWVIRSYAA